MKYCSKMIPFSFIHCCVENGWAQGQDWRQGSQLEAIVEPKGDRRVTGMERSLWFRRWEGGGIDRASGQPGHEGWGRQRSCAWLSSAGRGMHVVPVLACIISRGELAAKVMGSSPRFLGGGRAKGVLQLWSHESRGLLQAFWPSANLPSFLVICRCKHPHD